MMMGLFTPAIETPGDPAAPGFLRDPRRGSGLFGCPYRRGEKLPWEAE